MTVLIVDDAAFVRAVLKTTIQGFGHTVVGEAVNGEDAIKKARELNPDIITMDIVMPKLSGVEATKKIFEELPGIYIIILSVMGQKKMVVEAILGGAKDFVVKPFSKTRLEQALLKAK